MHTSPRPATEVAPRVRLAPSPTGGLHIGTARTALFNWLFARKHRGTFVLRIEDTDRTRSTQAHEESIVRDLRWLGLEWDEGVEVGGPMGPYKQVERTKIYRPYLDRLLAHDQAYYCFCTPEQLEEDRARAQKAGRAPIYSGRCCHLKPAEQTARRAAEKSAVIRFRVPTKTIICTDLIRGELTFQGGDFGDFVIAKGDGSPLFLFANIIDDALMKISHVFRGEDHLPNLPKQQLLAQALELPIPQYAHLPLILNPDRSKMSKRAGPTHVGEYRTLGYLPDAIVNYIALLGWNPGTTQELFTRAELTEAFEIKQINKAGSVFDIKRLQWVNAQYVRKLAPEDFVRAARTFLPAESKHADDSMITRALSTVRDRVHFLAELPELTDFFFSKKIAIDPTELVWKKSTPAETKQTLIALAELIASWKPAVFSKTTHVEQTLKEWVSNQGSSVGAVFWPLRVALTGKKASPGPQEVIWVLGKNESVRRVQQAAGLL